ncbi:hypothetical protein AXX17_AT1G31940 [Arabidopsis thaliana]|uniref:Uncharacterized protein n=1 Tax=Arabidopsis thaliana TaxID=3702 RepID=A0A178W3A2_ARATH|nr:hypothetical protein AXX17_AT1G31940 [Arabidopsis thaliana]
MELASLLMASTNPFMPSLFISTLDSSIFNLLSCTFITSLCLRSCLSSLSLIAFAITDTLLDNAAATVVSSSLLLRPTSSTSTPPPLGPAVVVVGIVLLRFAGDVSEYSLVSESVLLSFFNKVIKHNPNQITC